MGYLKRRKAMRSVDQKYAEMWADMGYSQEEIRKMIRQGHDIAAPFIKAVRAERRKATINHLKRAIRVS